MKLQKQLSQKRGDKVYHKFSVLIPNAVVDKLRWEDSQELVAETRGRTLILKPKNKDAKVT